MQPKWDDVIPGWIAVLNGENVYVAATMENGIGGLHKVMIRRPSPDGGWVTHWIKETTWNKRFEQMLGEAETCTCGRLPSHCEVLLHDGDETLCHFRCNHCGRDWYGVIER